MQHAKLCALLAKDRPQDDPQGQRPEQGMARERSIQRPRSNLLAHDLRHRLDVSLHGPALECRRNRAPDAHMSVFLEQHERLLAK